MATALSVPTGGPSFAPTTATASAVAGQPKTVATTGWRAGLPLLRTAQITLRELRVSDAGSLHAMLTTAEVARFISPPPTTVEGFERFIEWTIAQREAGKAFCFGIVPHGCADAVGIIQFRFLDGGDTAEWGFALGSPFWGNGMFAEGARQVLGFAFEQTGVMRIEARAAVANGRGNGALKKLGSVAEGVLRAGLRRNGDALDQVMWSMLREDWDGAALPVPPTTVVH